MNNRQALTFVGVCVIALGGVGAASAAPKLSSANGAGTLDGGARHFSFAAHQNADGTATGQAELSNRNFTGADGKTYRAHFDIQCMKTFGNIAFFGAVVTSTNDPNLTDAAYFSVQDNGEPGRTDQISRVFFFDDDPSTTGSPQLCQNNSVGDFPMQTIENGNIQVK